MQLVFDIWKEVARGARLEESMPRISRMVAESLPVGLLEIQRISAKQARLETAWVFADGSTPCPQRLTTSLEPAQLDTVLAWCARPGITRLAAGEPNDPVGRLLKGAAKGEALAGALHGEPGHHGILVLLGREGAAFDEAQIELARMLLEPFSAALANDRRYYKLDRDRRAIAADKDALLTRLERQDITGTLVGFDAGLRAVMENVEQVAATDAPVLILGETGTGKEVIARAIHSRSRKAGGPMFRVNCGAIPPQLVDAELFGHERGSFTGAVADRKGWFERADGGTLFLDEVGELPLAAQVRLLRVLQDGGLERVGGQRTITVGVRVVAATNADLEKMVATGRFREDLWYRLSVFPIRLPPLRDRMTDIPSLASHFAANAGKRLGGTPLVPTPADIELLVSYQWPGNVRELAAVIERAAILGDGKRLEIQAALGRAAKLSFSAPDSQPAQAQPRSTDRFLSLDEAQAAHIEAALARTAGRIEGERGAAKLLRINPHTLRARMRKLKIDWGRFRT